MTFFQYIISELGSLERMDEQIRALMAEMLMRNLANVESNWKSCGPFGPGQRNSRNPE